MTLAVGALNQPKFIDWKIVEVGADVGFLFIMAITVKSS